MQMDGFGSMDLGLSGDGGFSLGHQVTVHRIGDLSNPKSMHVPAHWTHDEFLNAASSRLDMVPGAKHVFNAHGVEVEDVAFGIEDDDILFLSATAKWRPPRKARASGGVGTAAASRGGEPVVGGYLVGKALGEGGFGQVRLGTHQVTKDTVALKFLKKTQMGSTSAAGRVVTEVQCLAELNHPNVIRLLQVLDEPQHCILVLQFAEGGDLRHYLESLPNHRMSEHEAHGVMRQIVSGISYAHKHRICHRDLKLENILLSGDKQTVKITDFGLSTFFKPGEMNKSSAGSLCYLPPEVLRGESNAGPPIDVWSLGVIMYALLFGALPFEAHGRDADEEEHRIRQRILRCDYTFPSKVPISVEARDLIRQMLHMNPDARCSIPQIFSHPWFMATGAPLASASAAHRAMLQRRSGSSRAVVDASGRAARTNRLARGRRARPASAAATGSSRRTLAGFSKLGLDDAATGTPKAKVAAPSVGTGGSGKGVKQGAGGGAGGGAGAGSAAASVVASASPRGGAGGRRRQTGVGARRRRGSLAGSAARGGGAAPSDGPDQAAGSLAPAASVGTGIADDSDDAGDGSGLQDGPAGSLPVGRRRMRDRRTRSRAGHRRSTGFGRTGGADTGDGGAEAAMGASADAAGGAGGGGGGGSGSNNGGATGTGRAVDVAVEGSGPRAGRGGGVMVGTGGGGGGGGDDAAGALPMAGRRSRRRERDGGTASAHTATSASGIDGITRAQSEKRRVNRVQARRARAGPRTVDTNVTALASSSTPSGASGATPLTRNTLMNPARHRGSANSPRYAARAAGRASSGGPERGGGGIGGGPLTAPARGRVVAVEAASSSANSLIGATSPRVITSGSTMKRRMGGADPSAWSPVVAGRRATNGGAPITPTSLSLAASTEASQPTGDPGRPVTPSMPDSLLIDGPARPILAGRRAGTTTVVPTTDAAAAAAAASTSPSNDAGAGTATQGRPAGRARSPIAIRTGKSLLVSRRSASPEMAHQSLHPPPVPSGASTPAGRAGGHGRPGRARSPVSAVVGDGDGAAGSPTGPSKVGRDGTAKATHGRRRRADSAGGSGAADSPASVSSAGGGVTTAATSPPVAQPPPAPVRSSSTGADNADDVHRAELGAHGDEAGGGAVVHVLQQQRSSMVSPIVSVTHPSKPVASLEVSPVHHAAPTTSPSVARRFRRPSMLDDDDGSDQHDTAGVGTASTAEASDSGGAAAGANAGGDGVVAPSAAATLSPSAPSGWRRRSTSSRRLTSESLNNSQAPPQRAPLPTSPPTHAVPTSQYSASTPSVVVQRAGLPSVMVASNKTGPNTSPMAIGEPPQAAATGLSIDATRVTPRHRKRATPNSTAQEPPGSNSHEQTPGDAAMSGASRRSSAASQPLTPSRSGPRAHTLRVRRGSRHGGVLGLDDGEPVMVPTPPHKPSAGNGASTNAPAGAHGSSSSSSGSGSGSSGTVVLHAAPKGRRTRELGKGGGSGGAGGAGAGGAAAAGSRRRVTAGRRAVPSAQQRVSSPRSGGSMRASASPRGRRVQSAAAMSHAVM